MRRPRGPGGRFLTAEEIAAQKALTGEDPGLLASPEQENDEDMGEDSAVEPPQSLLVPPNPIIHSHSDEDFMHAHSADSMNMMNISYRALNPSSISSPRISHSPQTPYSQPSMSPITTKPLPLPNASHNLYVQSQQRHTHGVKGTTNPAPITLSSPYPTPTPTTIRMHHVPHPHAHARHHHSQVNYTEGLYAQNAFGGPSANS